MHRRKLALVCFWIICLGLILPGWGHVPQHAAQAQGISSAALNLVAPAACPAGGCAAGQRLSYRLEYTLGQYDGLTDLPNVKVCLYVPNNWYDAASVQLDANGGVTGAAYTNTGVCSEDPLPPTNYSLLAAGEAKFYLTNVFNDSLGLSFRLAPTASVSGSVLLRVFERTGPAAWARTSQVFTSQSSPVATAATVYVAPDAASCPSGPCYLNSAGDAASGLGTGLKDAVDAAAPGSRIVVVGAATVKGNTVAVNKSLILEGQGNASLTGTGGCSNALVNFTAGGTLRGLNLQDGTCSAPDRPLVTINSPVDFLVEYNTFNSGSEALRITDNTGNLTVRFNQFNGISGKVLVWGSGSSPAALSMTANNIVGSPAGEMVECSEGGTAVIANRRVDHNYWSSGLPTTASHCVITPNKQLGAPAAQRANLPGVNASRVTVTNTKTYFMNNQVALQRSADGADFDMLLVDHGRSVPFDQGRTTGSPIPCSNYYDIFLAEGAAPAGSLDISLKYNATTACVAVVESSQYCELSTNTAKFPLYWYEPSGTVTAGWDTTGQNPAGSAAGGATGQTTVCDSAVDEVRVSVDNTGRPSLSADLNFTPFMVGIPIPATFQTLASNQTVTVRWTTTAEPNVTGFTVLRSLALNGPYSNISDLIPRRGSTLSGTEYIFIDGGRTNGVTNYYRLRVTLEDGSTILSDVLQIIPNPATVTPTFTPSRTFTVAPTRTQPIFIPTATRAPTRLVPTATRFVLTPVPINPQTRTLQATLATRTLAAGTPNQTQPPYPGENGTPATAGPDGGYPNPNGTTLPGEPTVTAGTRTPGTGTPSALTPTRTATVTRTPRPTSSAGEVVRDSSGWISLVLGLLMSGVVVGGIAWYAFLRKRVS